MQTEPVDVVRIKWRLQVRTKPIYQICSAHVQAEYKQSVELYADARER